MKNKISLSYLLGVFTLYLIFFPWVSFRLLDLDLQPWFIFFSLIYILVNWNKKLPQSILLGYIFSAIAFTVGFVTNPDFGTLEIRGFLSYLSFATSLHAYYIFRSTYPTKIIALTVSSNVIWIAGGLVQTLIGKEALSFAVIGRTTLDRGVTSLSPEPTYFATLLFCLSWLLLISIRYEIRNFKILGEANKIKKIRTIRTVIVIINIIGILFLARSVLILVFAIFSAIVVFLANFFDFKKLARNPLDSVRKILILFLVPIILFLGTRLLPDARFSKILGKIIETPMLIAKLDASINSRLAHLVLPIQGSIFNFLVPHGFSSYDLDSEYLSSFYDGFFWYGYSGDRIMSGTGSSMYELGIFGLIFLIWILRLSLNRKDMRLSLSNIIILIGIMSTAISIAFPLIACLVSEMYYQIQHESHGKINYSGSPISYRLENNQATLETLRQ